MRPFTQQAGVPHRSTRALRAGAVVALAAALSASALSAQEATAAGQTHTVKKGDTLWDIARAYLSDPFLWPEIYRLNTEVVEDPHWIYPGEVLKVPGTAQVATENRVEQHEPEMPVPASPGAPTVFAQGIGGSRLTVSRYGNSPAQYPHTAVRPGEFYAAPWVDRPGGPKSRGVLVAAVDLPGIAGASDRDRLGPQDRAYITLPEGIVAAKGDRFVVYDAGPEVEDGGAVMIPTGIVEVEHTDNGDATTVRLVQQFGEVKIGQGVVPLDRFTLGTEERPSPLMLGTESKVIYIPSGAVLPSVQRYVILDATMRDGVKVGDQFTLFRPRVKADVPGEGRQVVLPEEAIALAQVVKVTDRGTTAVIVDQRQPAIKEGTRAKLTARMP
ncbi:MAG TPA: LysM peptidoglycan-binding domain-containing protein [Gemmatimonadaceae bacterium]|nr:LysM peptidoglycan-binding domain-containing protein [Gemmatimonadaceae bacterium]